MKSKFVPYEKLSKKAKKKLNARKRKDWGDLKPIDRIVESKKVYKRSGRSRSDVA